MCNQLPLCDWCQGWSGTMSILGFWFVQSWFQIACCMYIQLLMNVCVFMHLYGGLHVYGFHLIWYMSGTKHIESKFNGMLGFSLICIQVWPCWPSKTVFKIQMGVWRAGMLQLVQTHVAGKESSATLSPMSSHPCTVIKVPSLASWARFNFLKTQDAAF